MSVLNRRFDTLFYLEAHSDVYASEVAAGREVVVLGSDSVWYKNNTDAAINVATAGATTTVDFTIDPTVGDGTASSHWLFADPSAQLEVDSVTDLAGLTIPADYTSTVHVKGSATEPSSHYRPSRLSGTTTLVRDALFDNGKPVFMASWLGITAATANARLQLDSFKGYFAFFPEGVIVKFENETYNWANTFDSIKDLEIQGCGETVFKLTGNTGRLFRTAFTGCKFKNFTIDYAGFTCTTGIELQDDAHNARVQGISFIDSDIAQEKIDNAGVSAKIAQTRPYGVMVRAANDVHVEDITSDNCGTVAWWVGSDDAVLGNKTGSERGVLKNVVMTSPSRQAMMLYVGWKTKGLIVDNLEMGQYDTNVLGGHGISFQGEGNPGSETPNVSIEGVRMTNIRITGRAGLGWESGVANGSHGDMIAIRCARDTYLSGYKLTYGGEFGIDVLAGSLDTYIGQGLVENMDGAAIVEGGFVGAQTQRTVIDGITIRQAGIDQAATPLGFSSIAGVRFLNSKDAKLMNAQVANSGGAAIYISNDPGTLVERLYVDKHSNSYRGNGTQNIGIGPFWHGQEGAPAWDGNTLTRNPVNNASNFTGVLDGVAAPSGIGGLYVADSTGYKTDAATASAGDTISPIDAGNVLVRLVNTTGAATSVTVDIDGVATDVPSVTLGPSTALNQITRIGAYGDQPLFVNATLVNDSGTPAGYLIEGVSEQVAIYADFAAISVGPWLVGQNSGATVAGAASDAPLWIATNTSSLVYREIGAGATLVQGLFRLKDGGDLLVDPASATGAANWLLINLTDPTFNADVAGFGYYTEHSEVLYQDHWYQGVSGGDQTQTPPSGTDANWRRLDLDTPVDQTGAVFNVVGSVATGQWYSIDQPPTFGNVTAAHTGKTLVLVNTSGAALTIADDALLQISAKKTIEPNEAFFVKIIGANSYRVIGGSS